MRRGRTEGVRAGERRWRRAAGPRARSVYRGVQLAAQVTTSAAKFLVVGLQGARGAPALRSDLSRSWPRLVHHEQLWPDPAAPSTRSSPRPRRIGWAKLCLRHRLAAAGLTWPILLWVAPRQGQCRCASAACEARAVQALKPSCSIDRSNSSTAPRPPVRSRGSPAWARVSAPAAARGERPIRSTSRRTGARPGGRAGAAPAR